jgi:nitroreductase
MEEYLNKIIKSRRSISEFTEKNIPNETLDELIEIASFAPSSTNTQPWFFVVFQSESCKDRLASYINLGYEKTKERMIAKNKVSGMVFSKIIDSFSRYGKFDSAPAYILVFARPYDKNVLSQIIRLSGNQNIEDIANESTKTSVAMAMQNLLLAAHAKGLGTRVKDGIKFFLNDHDLKNEFYSEFSIPNDYALISGIQMGYPTKNALKRVAHARLPLDKIRKYI